MLFPNLLSPELIDAQKQSDMKTPGLALLIQIICFALSLCSIYGLYNFRHWAPKLAIAGTFVSLACWPFTGGYAQSGIAVALNFLASYVWGAVLLVPYVTPLRAHFQQSQS